MEELKNYGIIEATPGPDDYVQGAATKLPTIVLEPTRNWDKYLPVKEIQYQNNYDSYGCVTFSKHNVLETLIKRKYNKEINFSDVFTIIDSGTQPGVGNYLAAVAEHPRKKGFLFESEYPWTKDMHSEETFYKPIPQEIKDKAMKRKDEMKFGWEWVDWDGCDPEELWNSLQYGPVQVTVQTWGRIENGVYQRIDSKKTNHAVELFGGEYRKTFKSYDSYQKDIKILSWDYYFGSAMRHDVIINTMFELIKGDKSEKVYFLGKDGTKSWIFNEAVFEVGRRKGLWGELSTVVEKPQAEVDAIKEDNTLIFSI